jgi:hypothetical protein
MGQAPSESYIEAQSVCGVYGTYTDSVTGSVYQMNGGCTDPYTASQVVAPTTSTTNETTVVTGDIVIGGFDVTAWWNGLSQDEQIMVVGGVGLVAWYAMKGGGHHSRGRFQ